MILYSLSPTESDTLPMRLTLKWQVETLLQVTSEQAVDFEREE
jgi:hypothetical protein